MESASNSSVKFCELCSCSVIKKNWARHKGLLKHLKKWAKQEGILDHDRKKSDELLEIKNMVESGRKDFSVYTREKLHQLAVEKKLEDAENLSREKLVRRLHKVEDYAARGLCNKLHVYNDSRLQELADNIGIVSDGKDRSQIIAEIYKKQGLFYCEPCKLAAKERELHEVSERHCIITGKGLNEVDEISKTGSFRTTVFNNTSIEPTDISAFLTKISRNIVHKLEVYSRDGENIKLFASLECDYERRQTDGGTQFTQKTYHTKAQEVYGGEEFAPIVTTLMKDLQLKEANLHPHEGSGWSLHKLRRVILKTAEFNPISAKSYIKLPDWVQAKKACVNIQNEDDRCFIYSILCSISKPLIHPERPNHYTDRLTDAIFQGFQYPMRLKDIPKFEKRSLEDIYNYPSMAVNVFETVKFKKRKAIENMDGEGLQNEKLKEEIRPVLISSFNKSANRIVDLLLITYRDKRHFVLIKDLGKLVRSQVTKCKRRIYLCRSCLSHFYSLKKLEEHEENCYDHDPARCVMPPPGTRLKFKNHLNKFPHPYVIYADWESVLKKIKADKDDACRGKTEKLRKHVPYGFSTYLVSRVGDEIKYQPYVYRARSDEETMTVASKFVENLHDILIEIASKYERRMDMDLTAEEECAFHHATTCHICEKPFEESSKKDRDHCHLTGNFMGAAHPECNRGRQLATKIPVFLHNMSNYDAHLFIEELFHYDGGNLTVIANTEEKYISFQKNMFHIKSSQRSRFFKLCFVDTFRFLPSSIEKLAGYLEDDQLAHLKSFAENCCHNYLEMDGQAAFRALRGKGIFPYDFIDNIEKLKHNALLEPSDFHDSLNSCEVEESDKEDEGRVEEEEEKRKASLQDYNKYVHVWSRLREKTLGSYSDLYNIQDSLLLADIFECFRDVCLKQYTLDPAHYLTAPSLAWDAMLKKTNCEIHLLTDINMHLMFEKGIRGGISQVSKRHAEANNEYLDGYDETKPTSFLMYLDACNLYGWALSQPLPYQHFAWVNVDSYSLQTWQSIVETYSINHAKGYILEVDLIYPQHLHDKHKDVPFASEHFNNKLCTTLCDKTKYVVHVRSLQQMLKHGLILTKVYRVISFTQESFIEPYVKFNSDMRKQSKNEFEKQFYKGMVNSVFGRTMMNVRNHQNIKLCTEKQASKLAKKPTFQRYTQFNEDFLACHLQRNKILLSQPIQVGCGVLEISKTHMYSFFYEKLSAWDPSIELVLMDTDSYLIKMHQDPYSIIKQHLDEFDTSNYPSAHPLYSINNKNVPGKFKDELGGNLMTEVVGLRSKLYTYLYNDSTDGKQKHEIRCKGIKKNVAKGTIRMKHFKEALFQNTNLYRRQMVIRSEKHQLFTETQEKLALSSDDDKRFILENKIDTLPWGHFKITVDLSQE